MPFRIDLRSEDLMFRWLGDLPPALRRYMPDGLKRGGALLVRTAQRLTEQADAIGATRDYYEGWRFEAEGIRDDGAFGFFYNDDPASYWKEHGRGAGGFPNLDDLTAWMMSKGIPLEARYAIGLTIAKRGTIKRKGYQGFEIMDQTIDMVREDVLDELDYALTRALRSTL